MERNDGLKLKITTGLVAAAMIGITVEAEGGRYNATPQIAEHALVFGHVGSDWVKSTARLVQSEPEMAQRLEKIATSTSIDDVRRGYALDALAKAGTEPAQKAMRETLSALADANDPVYPLLLARVGHLTSPSAETLSFVSVARTRAFNDADSDLAYAAQQTLDTVYGKRLASLYKKSGVAGLYEEGARQARTSPSRQRQE